MKVILKQDVKGLGKVGQTITVAEGYARNFLMPRGLAVAASEGALRSLAAQKKMEKAREDRELEHTRELKAKLHDQRITIKARAGESGRLFGAVTNKDVAEALSKLAGVDLDKKRVEMQEPIKALGEYTATVKLGLDQSARVQVIIVGE